MLKLFKKYFEVSKVFDSDILDKKINRKISLISILFALPVMIVYALILFTACTIFGGNMPILNIFVLVMPIFVCLFFGLVSLFTIQLYKSYLPEHELLQEVKNWQFFIAGLLNPYVIIFSIVISVIMCFVL